MIKTDPTYIVADNLTMSQMWKYCLDNVKFAYSSIWKWWKQTTLLWGVPVFGSSLFLLLFAAYEEFSSGEEIDWILLLSIPLLPIILVYPFVLIGSYYSSFIALKQIGKRINLFISKFIPDATDIKQPAPEHYTFWRDDLEFEIVNTHFMVPGKRGARRERYIVIALFYAPENEVKDKYFDQYGQMSDMLEDEWRAYREGKENCSHLEIDDNVIYAFFGEREMIGKEQVSAAIDEMGYLLERFRFFPLYIATEETKEKLRQLKKLD